MDNIDNKGRKVCCKVSLYKSSQRQRCSAINNAFRVVSIYWQGVAPFQRTGIVILGTEPFRSLALSFPGHFAPCNFRSVALLLRMVEITIYCEKFIQRNQSNLKYAVERAT